jgi:serine/threonine protein kinase/Tfp pilus assembly protein PilF
MPEPKSGSTGDVVPGATADLGGAPTLEETRAEPAGAAGAPGASPAVQGLRIGPYRIVRELGHGGMGEVYLAVRADESYEKQVAIKLIRGAGGSEHLITRFKRERQILARLEHPNIARLLDGGSTDDGLPYFVMEYIQGEPIDAHCDDRNLRTAERLRLFLSVCSAVSYAHRNLIVHRDIKPANILVAADGVPRLLDFGIATLIEPEAGAAHATAIAFTPSYASPEQIRGEPLTTATDVYSLGVVLYELLTGHDPYRLVSLQPLEMMKAIVEGEVEAPSAAVARPATLARGQTVVRIAPEELTRTREASIQKLRQRLRGDLDTILMTALRKEAQRRYPSVEAFAEDIRRHLEGLPITARKGGLAYRAGKFLRRHRLGAAAAALVAALLVGSAVNVVVQSRRVARQRDHAERISSFLANLFTISDPGEARGNSVTAREILDKGVERIGTDLQDQPELRADLMDTMGHVYDRLGLYDRAAGLLRDSLAIRRTFAGSDPKALAKTLNELGNVLYDKSDLEGAEKSYREALTLRRRLFGPDSRELAESLNNLAGPLEAQGHDAEAEALFQEALAIKRRLPNNERAVATTLRNLSVLRYKKGDLATAQEGLREVVALQRQALGPDHPEVAYTLQDLGVLLDTQGDYAAAEKTYREALELQHKVLGAEHPDIATTLTNLANTINHSGRPEVAEPVYREALEMSRKMYGADSTDVASVLVGLGDVLGQRGQLAPAEDLLRQAMALQAAKLGDEHVDLATTQCTLAEVLRKQGRLPEAEALARRCLAIREVKLPKEHADLADGLIVLGLVLLDQKRPAEAAAVLLPARDKLEAAKAPPSARRRAADALARLDEQKVTPPGGRALTSPSGHWH